VCVQVEPRRSSESPTLTTCASPIGKEIGTHTNWWPCAGHGSPVGRGGIGIADVCCVWWWWFFADPGTRRGCRAIRAATPSLRSAPGVIPLAVPRRAVDVVRVAAADRLADPTPSTRTSADRGMLWPHPQTSCFIPTSSFEAALSHYSPSLPFIRSATEALVSSEEPHPRPCGLSS
jgi:hypothetical protein